MKKQLILASILLILAPFVFSQTKIEKLSVTYGDELPDDKQVLVKIIGEANGKIYGLATQKDDYYVQVFESGSMKQTSSVKIIIPELNDKEVEFENIFLLNSNLYVIGSVYSNKDKIFNLMATTVSENGVLSKNSIKLFEAEVAKKSAKGNFYFKEAVHHDGLLIMHTCEFSKEDAVKYEVKLFDEDMGQIFVHSEKVIFDDHKKDFEFTISDFDLDLNQDVFLVINESYRDSKKKEKVEKFEVHAFKKSKSYEKEIIKINFKDKEIINCAMLGTAQNTLKLVGFYSSVRENGKAFKELKGVYNITVNISDNTTSNPKFNEFTYDTKAKIMGKRRASKGKDIQPLYNICNIIERDDGGLIILSEYQTVVVGRSTGIGPLSMTPVTYTKNEIIITSLKPDGTLDWSNVLPKEQKSTVSVVSTSLCAFGVSGAFAVGVSLTIPLATLGKGPEYLGAIPIYSNKVLNMVFNDNAKNKGITDIDEIKDMGNYKNTVPTLFMFDDKGELVRKDPEEATKQGLVIRPGVFCRKTEKELIVYSSRMKKDKLGRLIIED